MSNIVNIAKGIIQTNIYTGNILKICLNPAFLNLNLRRQQFALEHTLNLKYETLPIHSIVSKDKIITNIYEPKMVEYLFYSPVEGEIININYDLLTDLNKIFTSTYQRQDVIDKLCIAEIEIEDAEKYFMGYN